MSKKDFDELVEKVIKQRSSLASMRPVVEKENALQGCCAAP